MVFPTAALRALLSILLLALVGAGLPAQAADIVASPNDQRHYESFELPNRLRVVLVSDPTTDKAAAALDVNIGSGSDPAGREGLAHFLEHMLFLGTEKYPQAGEYQNFISAHGGNHNAYTALEHTNYFFDIDRDYLEPALDRFAQFFIAPLFTADYVNRERNIVDSEYQSKRKNDNWRSLHAFKRALNPNHPFARFSTGSATTLQDRNDSNIRAELIGFYERYYSANLMTLVVLGKEPLLVLRQWASEKFSAVRNIDAKPLAVSEPLFTPASLPARLDVVPVKDQRTLTLTFPIPATDEHYRSKPTFYIGHLLGHEGTGSLLSLLKKKGWSDGLAAGQGATIGQEATFYIAIELTEASFDHVPEIVAHVFQAIRLVQAEGVNERLFDEQRQLAELSFRFQEPSAPIHHARAIAANMHKYPTADVLRGPYIMERYDPGLIQRILAALTPENLLLTVTGKDLVPEQTDPWYDTPYRLTALDTTWVQAWQTQEAAETLAIPGPNIFLPRDLAAKPPGNTARKPQLVKNEEGLALWHQQDMTYQIPRADFYFTVRSPLANDSPAHAMLTELYVQLVNDQINELAYPARLAGLSYTLYTHIRGFSVRISGYSDKQALLLARLAKTLRQPTLNPERFVIFKEQVTRRLANAAQEPPYTRTLAELRALLLKPYWDEVELLEALQTLELADLQRFIPELLAAVEVVVLSHGNIQRAEALELAAVLEDSLLAKANPVDVPKGRILKLANGSPPVRRLDTEHDDSALALYYQGGDTDFATRARFALLGQVLEGAFFHQLRTVDQLGYVVFTSPMPLLEVPGLVFVVQSPIADPVALTERVKRFLADYAEELMNMNDETFVRHKQGLITRILEKEQNLQERSNRYWEELDREQFTFDSRERLAAAVERISKEELVAFFHRTLLGEQSKTLMVYAFGNNHKDEILTGKTPADKNQLILNVRTFKEESEFFSG